MDSSHPHTRSSCQSSALPLLPVRARCDELSTAYAFRPRELRGQRAERLCSSGVHRPHLPHLPQRSPVVPSSNASSLATMTFLGTDADWADITGFFGGVVLALMMVPQVRGVASRPSSAHLARKHTESAQGFARANAPALSTDSGGPWLGAVCTRRGSAGEPSPPRTCLGGFCVCMAWAWGYWPPSPSPRGYGQSTCRA